MVFIDASAWIALFHIRDKYHKTAWIVYEDCNAIVTINSMQPVKPAELARQ
jgi:predicted nucleic acid-binding protein